MSFSRPIRNSINVIFSTYRFKTVIFDQWIWYYLTRTSETYRCFGWCNRAPRVSRIESGDSYRRFRKGVPRRSGSARSRRLDSLRRTTGTIRPANTQRQRQSLLSDHLYRRMYKPTGYNMYCEWSHCFTLKVYKLLVGNRSWFGSGLSIHTERKTHTPQ